MKQLLCLVALWIFVSAVLWELLKQYGEPVALSFVVIVVVLATLVLSLREG